MTVDDEELFPGFDHALKSMSAGEKALFVFSPKQAFGTPGNADLGVPPNTSLKAEVTLVELDETFKESWQMEPNEKIDAAEFRKSLGNKLFQQVDIFKSLAVSCYFMVVAFE